MNVTRDELIEILNAALAPIHTKLDVHERKFDVLEGKFDVLERKFDVLEGKVDEINIKTSILSAKSNNASCDINDLLTPVPLGDGTVPDCEHPATLSSLIVAGNEMLPNKTANTWNRRKSLALIRKHINGYGTDDENEDEFGSSARRRRLLVCKLLGVSTSQISFAQLMR